LATHISAEKRSRQADKHCKYNNAVKSKIKTGVKTVVEAVEKKDAEAAKAALAQAVPAIAKAAAKGAFHKKAAARKIARLTKRVNTLKV